MERRLIDVRHTSSARDIPYLVLQALIPACALGGEYGYGIGDVVNDFTANGQWNFNAQAGFTGDSFADFLLGRFNTLRQGIGEYRRNRFHRLALFAQDSWKLHRASTSTSASGTSHSSPTANSMANSQPGGPAGDLRAM